MHVNGGASDSYNPRYDALETACSTVPFKRMNAAVYKAPSVAPEPQSMGSVCATVKEQTKRYSFNLRLPSERG